MMRIGILTFHAAHNYGAVLQCYALQFFLESQGYEVEVIDYRQPYLLNVYKAFDVRRFLSLNPLRCCHKFVSELRLTPWRRRRYHVFEMFISQHLHLAPVSNIMASPYDVIVVGSDQVWNTTLTNGYNPYYWGAFSRPSSTRLIAYGASMEGNPSEEKCKQMCKRLQPFSRISVREHTLATILSQKCGIPNVDVVDDPTLLMPSSFWSDMAGERLVSYDYVFLYEVNPHPRAETIAKNIARWLNIELITLSSLFEVNRTPLSYTASPQTFLNLTKYASFVVASSFHGTVFALHFARPFVSIKSGSGLDSRVANLLAQVGLSGRFTCDVDESLVAELEGTPVAVDFDNEERSKSVTFLHDAILGNSGCINC